ncbi:MAG TPA: tetratricopeptide repeat protein [Terriglobia bacterium]|nr:tetratricopeptide repeat protein [Terriglobia bacterium]
MFIRIKTRRLASLAAAVLLAGCLLSARLAMPQDAGKGHPSAAAMFTQARESLARGDTAAALKAVNDGLRLAPHNVTGLNLLGIILARQGQRAQALAAFGDALKADPQSAETHDNLGSFYEGEEKLDLAENEFRATLRAYPADRTANYNVGALLLLHHDAQRALPYLLHVQPPDVTTGVALVEANIELHRTSKAIALARSLSAKSTQDARLHFSLGVVLDSGGQHEIAIHELEMANALKPGYFTTLRQLGSAYLNAGDYAKADRVLTQALAIKPDSVDALGLEAEAYSHENKTLEAFQLLFKARKLAPENTGIIYLLAGLSMKLAYYSDAIPLLEQGVKLAPKQPDLRAALGESYYQAGKIEDAFDQFRTLIQLDPSASSYAFMGLFYLHQGQFTQAQEYFEKGLQKNPGDAQCLYNLGAIADKQGNFAGGQKYLEEALAAKPDYGDALYELASAKIEAKQFAQAIVLLNRCAKADPNKARTYYKLAVAERSLHQTEAAERDFKVFQTLAKNPASMPMPFQDFFATVQQKVSLSPEQQAEVDLKGLEESVKQHPDQPRLIYLLAETYLKLGQTSAAGGELAHLCQVSSGDARTMTGAGVLLARYKLYPDAIQYFQMALAADPNSDDAKYDLADAYYETRDYAHALEWLQQISPQGRNDPFTLALLGDTEARLGHLGDAEQALKQAIQLSPDDDSHYVSLALTEILSGDLAAAQQTLAEGRSRVPDSGRIAWGMGVLSVMEGDNAQAERKFEQALDLMPQWESSYSALGTFYFDTGQVAKAQQTLNRYAELFPHGLLNVNSLRSVLADAAHEQAGQSEQPGQTGQNRQDGYTIQPMSPQTKSQFLAMALALEGINP